jgi:hypothetical protein
MKGALIDLIYLAWIMFSMAYHYNKIDEQKEKQNEKQN